jgi:hypothetical protein
MFDVTSHAAPVAAPVAALSTEDAVLEGLPDGELQDELYAQAAHLTVAECRLVL